MKTYDLIVIGTGAANIVTEAAQNKKWRIAQIEKGPFGGTCLNRGCIPTKVLTTAADRILEIKEAEKLGVFATKVHGDWQKVRERVFNRIQANEELEAFYEKDPHVDVYRGTASFCEHKTVQVTYKDGTISEPITAPTIVIATGAETRIPTIEGLDDVPYITSESFFSDAFPKEVYLNPILLGGGAIGCEFAHIFSAFGSDVTLVQHNVRLLPKADAEASQTLLEAFKERDITVYLNKETPKVRKENDGIVLTLEDRETGKKEDIRGSHLLIVPGVAPATKALNVEKTGLSLSKKGAIETNEFLETAVEGIYALGDVNGRLTFRHKANYEADILAHNIVYHPNAPEKWRWASYTHMPAVTFTAPEVAQVGYTEEAAKDAGFDVLVGKNDYADTAKGFALGIEEKGHAWAKTIIDKKTGDILGFHAIGPWASTLIQPFHNLMAAGKQPLTVVNEEIASEAVKKLREHVNETYRDPHHMQTVRESLVAHPSLQEVGIWTHYDLPDENAPSEEQ